jgi:nucleoside-diphosphate kinase
MCSGVAVGMELVCDNAIKRWRAEIGPTNVDQACAKAPGSIRAKFGTKGSPRFNAVHGSDSPASAERELNIFFGHQSALKGPTRFKGTSVAIIKPHILKQKQLGAVVDFIQNAGFGLSSLQMFYLDHPVTEEFFAVYKGILPEYAKVCENMINGPCVVAEVYKKDCDNVVSDFR